MPGVMGSSQAIILSKQQNGVAMPATTLVIDYSTRGVFHHGKVVRFARGSKNWILQSIVNDGERGLGDEVNARVDQVVKEVVRDGSYRTADQCLRALTAALIERVPEAGVHGPYEMPDPGRHVFDGRDTLKQAVVRLRETARGGLE